MKSPFLVLLATLCALPGTATAQEPASTDVHVVDAGDTLWDLARSYLGNPFLWSTIWELNREIIADPDLIYPAERIRLPGASQARTVDGGPAPVPAAANPAPRGATPVQVAAAGPTVFGRGAAPAAARSDEPAARVAARSASVRLAVPTGAFYAAGMLVPDTAIARLGELTEVAAATVIPVSQSSQIQPYDRVYVALDRPAEVGDRIQFLRRGREIKPFGRVHTPTGTGRVVAAAEGTATVEIDRMFDNMAIGDIAVPLPAFADLTGAVTAPATGLDGVVIDVVEPQPVVSREDVVLLNLGTASGVSEGDEFEIYIPETQADWGVRPALDVARVRVVRAELLTSAARVIEMTEPAIAPGLPVRLVGTLVD